MTPFIPVLHKLGSALQERLRQFVSSERDFRNNCLRGNDSSDNDQDAAQQSLLSRAFSQALCIISRQTQAAELQPRILVFQFGKDKAINYNSLMNSVFRYEALAPTF